MNKLLNYKDDVVLVDTYPDDYGDMGISHVEKLKGLFVQGTSQTRTGYVDAIGTDAHVYLDINNAFVQENAFYKVQVGAFSNKANAENVIKTKPAVCSLKPHGPDVHYRPTQ